MVRAGDRVRARVVEVLEGVILLAVGDLRGAVNIVDLTWDERVHVRTSDFATAGDDLEVRVLAVDGDRFSASLKHLHPEDDPWRAPPAPGDQHAATVRAVRDWGVFVALDHLPLLVVVVGRSDLRVAQRVTVEIVRVDTERRRLEAALGPPPE